MSDPLSSLPQRVTVVEVGPRDGLQNEAAFVPAQVKIAYVNALSDAGLPVIEVTSFVSAKAIPQLADGEDVMRGIRRVPNVRYPVLVPNLQGLENALAAGAREIAIFTAASETFNKRNINASIDESFERFAPVCERAAEAGVRVRGYVSTAFGCPYEGAVPVAKVAEVVRRLLDLGVAEVSAGDTIGVATPNQVVDVWQALTAFAQPGRLAFHFHDTRGTALANVVAALECGATIFDASSGGLGGCPFAPGASGNLATEDLVYMLDGLGIETGVLLPGVVKATAIIAAALDHPPRSKYYQAATAAWERT